MGRRVEHMEEEILHMYIIKYVWERDYRLCGLPVRVPGNIMEMYCASCEVRTEFTRIYVM
jgi:hypothetical protein